MTAVDGRTGVRQLLAGMLTAGLPNLLAAALLISAPLLGRIYLSTEEYALWALVATVATVSLVLDFGAPAYVMRSIARGASASRAIRHGVLLSVGGSLGFGVLACVAWPFYVQVSGLQASDVNMRWLLLGAGIASGARAAFVVITSAQLALDDKVRRGVLILAQAALQVGLVWLLLDAGVGVASFVAAMLLSSLVSCAAALLLVRHVDPRLEGDVAPGELRAFVSYRTLATVLGMALTQGDRWVLGVVASPTTLANYDTAARLASVPRVIAINLSVVLVVEAATRAGAGPRLRTLHRRAVGIVGIAIAVALAVVAGSAAMLDTVLGFALIGSWPMFLGILAWYGANALTAPTTLIAAGTGRPQAELRYLVPCFALTVLVWGIGIWHQSSILMIYGAGAALGLTSLWFTFVDSRRLWEGQRNDLD